MVVLDIPSGSAARGDAAAVENKVVVVVAIVGAYLLDTRALFLDGENADTADPQDRSNAANSGRMTDRIIRLPIQQPNKTTRGSSNS